MATINVSLPSDGNTIDASDYNTPITAIVNEFNGNIDNDNIKSGAAIAGSKIANASVDLGAKASTWDGWIAVSDSWSYASATTVTVPTDATTKYSKGDFVKFDQTSTKYFRITNVASTTLTLQSQTDGVSVANAAITGIYYSKSATPQSAPLNGVPWWEEIGRTTLTSAGDTITVSSLPTRKYLKILVFTFATGGTINNFIKFNNDTGANYASRFSNDGGADATATSSSSESIMPSTSTAPSFATIEVLNVATLDKLCSIISTRNTAGAATAPGSRRVGWLKWANTTDQISRVDVLNSGGTGDFAIGSEVVVLGHD